MSNASFCPPPRNFSPAGAIRWVRHSRRAPAFTFNRDRPSGAQRAGQLYEEKAQRHFSTRYPLLYVESPWLNFSSSIGGERWCQPDAWLVDLKRGVVTVLEYKLRHTADAWWQLRKLYEPVTRALFGVRDWEIAVMEIVQWYDPATTFPEKQIRMQNIDELEPGRFGVHQWDPRFVNG